jgi:hypothetical protein
MLSVTSSKCFARAAVAILAIGFAFELIVSIVEKPYTAISSFGWAGPRQAARVEVLVPEIVLYYADSSIVRLTDTELFDEVPIDRQNGVARNVLSQRQRPEQVASLERWLALRARAIHPSSTPTKCVVHWYRNSAMFDPHSGHIELEGRIQELSGTLGVNLDEDAALPL